MLSTAMSSALRVPTAPKLSFKSSLATGDRLHVISNPNAVIKPGTTVCSLTNSNSRREAVQMIAIGAASLFAVDRASAADAAKGDAKKGPLAKVAPLTDFRKMNKESGFQEIYEARELTSEGGKPKAGEATRFAVKKLDPEGTKARIAESQGIFNNDLLPLIEVEAYPRAQSEMRRQIGYLRFDMNAIIATMDKDSAKVSQTSKKTLLRSIEKLDFALREKKQDESKALLSVVIDDFANFKNTVA